jgi:hypothetical protein
MMDNLAIVAIVASLVLSFHLGRYWQLLKVGSRLARIAHIDALWEADCKATRANILELREDLQMCPWWRG